MNSIQVRGNTGPFTHSPTIDLSCSSFFVPDLLDPTMSNAESTIAS